MASAFRTTMLVVVCALAVSAAPVASAGPVGPTDCAPNVPDCMDEVSDTLREYGLAVSDLVCSALC